jgi:hypothetical protein
VPKKKLPQEVIDAWPEVFGDVDVKSVPLEYLHSINVQFKNKDTWVIGFDKTKDITPEEVNRHLNDLFEEYEDDIVNVDFKLDTEKVKYDVKKRTKYFMKKRK